MRHSGKAGLPPGSMVHIGRTLTDQVGLRATLYSENRAETHVLARLSELDHLGREEGDILWLDVTGVDHVSEIQGIGEAFHLHPLLMEDVVNTEQRPKYEEFGDCILFTLKWANPPQSGHLFRFSQFSVVFGKGYVISFSEKDSSIFDDIRERILSGNTRAWGRKSDFLAYLLIDRLVDGHYYLVEKLSDEIEDLEDQMLKEFNSISLVQFQHLKRNLVSLKKALYPLREALSRLEKRDHPLLDPQNLSFFRDVYDHTVHMIESVDNERDILSGVMDVALSSLNNRMNSIMKVLTIIATIFIPLSFIASVYGMNFDYFPELHWKYGYLFFWLVIMLVFIGMVIYLKRKKWW